jgi:hypothetical protein
MNNEKNQLRDLTELILRHDEHMNKLQELQKDHQERMGKMEIDHQKRMDRMQVIIDRLDAREVRDQEIHNELLRLSGRCLERIDRSDDRMDRIEKNLDRLIEGLRTGGRNGRE